MNDKVIDTGDLLTAEGVETLDQSPWTERFVLIYQQATEELIPVLEKMIDNSRSFEDLRTQVTALIANRKAFVDAANKILP